MFKKIIALILTIVICFGTVTAFANSDISFETETIEEDGVTKTVIYFGEIKIVSWEKNDELIVEQYDADGTWVETNVGNRISKEITVYSPEESYTTYAENVIGIINEEDLPAVYSFNKVASIKAINSLTGMRKTMDLYEELGSAKNTTYKVSKYNGTLANFISAVAIGIGISSLVAGKVVSAMVEAGLGIISGKIIDFTSSVTLSCKAYPYNYYGKDSSSGDKSDTYKSAGHKYVINDDDHIAFKNKVYYDGLVYDKINSTVDYNLGVMIVRNLYGIDFDIY